MPPGLTLDSRTGRLQWVTGEADGGREVPVLAPTEPQRVRPEELLTVTLSASDADLPVQTLTYRFAEPPPAGMTIDAGTGQIAWTPALADANRTVLVSVAVRDAGSPLLESTVSFPVTVEPAMLDRPPQFYGLPIHLLLTGTTRSLEVLSYDPDGDAVTLALPPSGLPGLSLASTPGTGRGVLSWNMAGVDPGLYALPVQAVAKAQAATYAPTVKVVPDNRYWQWASGTLDQLDDAAKSDPTANADHDATANVFEWALLRDPRLTDETPWNFTLQNYGGGWLAAELNLHRRRGSNQFVTLTPQAAGALDAEAWSDIPTPDWEVFLDPYGDRDSDPESEEVLFRFWLSPADPVAKKFFRIKAATRELLP